MDDNKAKTKMLTAILILVFISEKTADLILFLSNYGTVSKKNIEYKRFKSNNSKKESTLNEYLIHLKKD